MTTVARIIASKPNVTVHAIEPDKPVLQAVKMMAEHRIGALLVMQGEKIVGILSERDYARKVVLMGRSSDTTPVKDIMTADVMYVSPEESNMHCMALMTENRLRHLPVLDKEGKLVGLISIGDLVKDIISEQQFVIEQLEHYIRGDR
jgi:CBS domain-containing protein